MERLEQTPVQILHQILEHARLRSVSDIHCEPSGRVRFRSDGILSVHDQYGRTLMRQVISLIKVRAQLDIAQELLPQEGMFTVESAYSVRVSLFPTQHGEKAVLRLLSERGDHLTLDNLGLPESLVENLTQVAQKHQGFFLVTGPTGSGKSTTLSALLRATDLEARNVVTLEDPIEYQIDGAAQSTVGSLDSDLFNYSRALRSLLRQDPDVILIGEIRDKETARGALQAALTGHLVLSTLHTTSAWGAVTRLQQMGVPRFLLAQSLTGVLAQRLVRKLCQACRKKRDLTPAERLWVTEQQLALEYCYESAGCDRCNNTGVSGRSLIIEPLFIDDQMRLSILSGENGRPEIHTTLIGSACTQVAAGIISLNELMLLI